MAGFSLVWAERDYTSPISYKIVEVAAAKAKSDG
jgi:hypothetical protein